MMLYYLFFLSITIPIDFAPRKAARPDNSPNEGTKQFHKTEQPLPPPTHERTESMGITDRHRAIAYKRKGEKVGEK
jgi:hypothetical protein